MPKKKKYTLRRRKPSDKSTGERLRIILRKRKDKAKPKGFKNMA